MGVSASAHLQVVTTILFDTEPELHAFWEFVERAAHERSRGGVTDLPLVVSQFLDVSERARVEAQQLAAQVHIPTSANDSPGEAKKVLR